ncbi:MAG: 30S ribosomal protein S8 [Candidatus Dormibacteraeota bacterium]|nr:30S ribosomal protein S8 [Candidatus Dormibacteraeota bacterium]
MAAQTKAAARQKGTGVVSDPVADMLTRIRNAVRSRHDDVRIPSSTLKVEVARVLKEEGYIDSYEVSENEGAGATLRIVFKVRSDRRQVITGLKRISRPGLRVYARKTEIPRVLGGLGISILSTSQGVMSGRAALHAGVGGEVLAYVW